MRKVESAPNLRGLVGAAGTSSRPLAARVGSLNAEPRVVGETTMKSHAVGSRAGPALGSVGTIAGTSVLSARAPQPASRSMCPPCAVALPNVAPVVTELTRDISGVAKSVEEEVVVESGLHVVGVAAGGCYERFGVLPKLAPSLVDDSDENGTISNDELDLATCILTPFEAGENGDPNRAVQRSLDDLVLKSEIRFEFECALDSLSELSLSDEKRKVLQRSRSPQGRRRWRRKSFGDEGREDSNTGREVEGNVVPVTALLRVLRRTLPPSQSA